jgi:branched-chain amino acid transport system permease protein
VNLIERITLKQRHLLWLLPLVLPFLLDGYLLRLTIVTTFGIIVATTLNIIYGYVGLASLGHAAFYGIGAYTSAILVAERGVPVVGSIVIATVVVGIISLLVGIPLLRTSGLYFSIVTLAFNVVVYQIMANWNDVTQGTLGYRNIPTFANTGGEIFIMIYLFLLAILIFKRELLRSYVGKALLAIREDEELATELGVNVFAYKTGAFVVSSMLAGTAGAMFAHYNGFLAPNYFTIFESFNYFVLVTVGGAGTILGPVVGGALLTLLPEALRIAPEIRLLAYGLMLIVIIIVMPDGIVGAIRNRTSSPVSTLRSGVAGVFSTESAMNDREDNR